MGYVFESHFEVTLLFALEIIFDSLSLVTFNLLVAGTWDVHFMVGAQFTDD